MNWTFINSLFGTQRQIMHQNLINSHPNNPASVPEKLAEKKSEEPISKQEDSESKWYSKIEIKTEEEPSVVTHIYIDGKEMQP